MAYEHLSLCDLPEFATPEGWARLKVSEDLAAVRRISVGSCFCEKRFLGWGAPQIDFLQALTARTGAALSLVMPCPRESLYDEVVDHAQRLLRALPACDEVVYNDPAMLRAPLFPAKKRVAGRLLCKYEHDFRLDNAHERVEALRRALDALPEAVEAAEADTFDLALCAENLPALSARRIRFHFPAVMLSSTRHCQFAVRDLAARDLLSPYDGCRQQCGQVWTAYRDRVLKFGRGIYRLLPPEATPPESIDVVYWPIAAYRGRFD